MPLSDKQQTACCRSQINNRQSFAALKQTTDGLVPLSDKQKTAAPAAATVLTAEGAEAAAATKDANHGLVKFQLVPKVGASCQ